MSKRRSDQVKLRKSIERSMKSGRVDWQRYQATHGAMSLATHIYMSSQTKGFPVLVRSHSRNEVRCLILQTGEEFTVGMDEYKRHRGRDFLLDPALEKTDPETFQKHAKWFRDAYKAVGITLSEIPDYE